MSENTNIKPIPEWSPGFHSIKVLVTGSQEKGVLATNTSEAASIILRVSLPLFRAKIENMGTLDMSLTVRVKDCFCPLQMDMFEFTRSNWLGVLSEMEGQLDVPEIMVREVRTKKHLHFRFSVTAKAKQQFCRLRRYHWTGDEKHYED